MLLGTLAACSVGTETPTASGWTAEAPRSSSPAAEALGVVGFRTVTLIVTRPDGTTEEWCLWLADAPALRAQGLMEVTDPELGGAAGMVFSFPEDTSRSFWMRNTPLPLSIAWYGADGQLVSTADMDPCPADAADDACPRFAPDGSYRYAVEVPQGRLAALGLVEGSTIELADACVLTA